ncbi:MAG: thioredoxin [Ignavibacteria bacterium GWB2_35_12]|nr:MAG: thioredoxin [Ignavibacteria bacterium GWB2_35_12]OGU86778.1 MAG: thioredoxin [Ignavibacteria bacterium RIFOXYA2_FULL_35_10]OGV23138.1 MAG: thioredoxin [Ignavibacteria bacterium RIFOXYC2_FULL_35_21]
MEIKTNTNRLINESSPYLQQHANNPVDWFPWCDEAFDKAKKEDKPVFLSIGYSTCHWCHVMAHESFEDEEIAKLMNDSFINIKVDREERPDIDSIYMQACQMFTGGGGWPLTVIMTPDKKPFFAGTYFPKQTVRNRIGMDELISRINDYWQNNRNQVDDSTDEILTLLNQRNKINNYAPINNSIFERAFKELSFSFDTAFGGFGKMPKFPMPSYLFYLLRDYSRNNNIESLKMVEKTLQEMRKGGIFDHIGFGFHRYSTDERWLVPHFEKMLYDQALLSLAYTEAYQVTKKDEYKKTTIEILDYVQRVLASPEGAFYSAEDADSEGGEGKFYLWKTNEIDELLGSDSTIWKAIYNINETGNFFAETGESENRQNIPHLKTTFVEIQSYNGINKTELNKKLEQMREILFDAREKRIHPHLDDKVLTDWNGLMLASFARAAAVFRDDSYLKTAKTTATFFMNNMRTIDGRLLHRFRQGNAGIDGMLDDYAFFIWGLIELYEACFDLSYLKSAIELMNISIDYYWPEENYCFYQTASDSENLITRKLEFFDGALPSGNSVQFDNLIKLGRMTGNNKYIEKAGLLTKSFSESVNKAPTAYSHFLCGYDSLVNESVEIVIVGDLHDERTAALINKARELFIPNAVLMHKPSNDSAIDEFSELTKLKTMLNNQPTAYFCRNNTCQEPVNDADRLKQQLLISNY